MIIWISNKVDTPFTLYIKGYLADIFSKNMKEAYYFKENDLKVSVDNDKIQIFEQKTRTLENLIFSPWAWQFPTT